MITLSNIEHYTVYGIDIIYDKEEAVYRAFVGGKKYEHSDFSSLKYIIQNLQNGVGVVH